MSHQLQGAGESGCLQPFPSASDKQNLTMSPVTGHPLEKRDNLPYGSDVLSKGICGGRLSKGNTLLSRDSCEPLSYCPGYRATVRVEPL